MSWKGGSELMSLIISNVKEKMDAEYRETLYKELIEYFENEDCDTLYECLHEDSIFDKAYDEYSYFALPEEELDDDRDWDPQDNGSF